MLPSYDDHTSGRADGSLRSVGKEGTDMRKGSNDAPGMRGYRSRTSHGPLRVKRGDTHMITIEETYNLDLRVRDDMHLDTYLKQKNLNSLNDLITDQ